MSEKKYSACEHAATLFLFSIPLTSPTLLFFVYHCRGDRQKYGLLEKKKDYLERARDFHKKERTIQKLKVKASERNPDEFYFAMENAKTKDGIHDGRCVDSYT